MATLLAFRGPQPKTQPPPASPSYGSGDDLRARIKLLENLRDDDAISLLAGMADSILAKAGDRGAQARMAAYDAYLASRQKGSR